ncbi:MAG: universal stress protein [Clostridiales bacterium]|nr:universal stress protein [Clostridiales bacterium]
MNKTPFPRTQVGGISVSRFIIGSNWMAGYSHRSDAADQMIKEQHCAPQTMYPMFDTFMEHGIDTVMAPFGMLPHIYRSVMDTSARWGQEMILVDTPVINVDDSAAGRREAQQTIQECAARGAKICLIHHYSAEQLVDKNKRCLHRLDDYTKMIRDAGMVPGLSAHMPELVVYSDENGYDVETYIQIYNCMGFLMQVEIESVNAIIRNAKKPVMVIKAMAAGRTTPFVGLNFAWATIRDCDMITVGCFNEREAAEDIEISMAALERRSVNLAKRSSPAKNQTVLAGNTSRAAKSPGKE